METTFCGRDCEACEQREKLNCPGCQEGPGRLYGGECVIANCSRTKGHTGCSVCEFRNKCAKLRKKESMPQSWSRRIEEKQARKAESLVHAAFLGKWLSILFWMVIPIALSSLMTKDTVIAYAPKLYLPGQILNAVFFIMYGCILLKLRSEDSHYQVAGICTVVAGAVTGLFVLVTLGKTMPDWSIYVSVPVMVLEMVSEYNEFAGHSGVLSGFDAIMSGKWKALWKWYVVIYGIVLLSPLLVMVFGFLGAILTMVAAFAVIAIGIVKLCYLYNSAKLFREFKG